MARLLLLTLALCAVASHRASCADAPGAPDLMDAAAKGDTKRITYLIRNQIASVTDAGDFGWTALHHAAYHGQDDACIILLLCGADLAAKADAMVDLHGFTAKKASASTFATMNAHHGTAGILRQYAELDDAKRAELLTQFMSAQEAMREEDASLAIDADDAYGPDRAEQERHRLAAQKILDFDASAIADACAKVHLDPRGETGTEVLASARAKISPSCAELLREWERADRDAMVALLGEHIGASGLALTNRISKQAAAECLRKVAAGHQEAADRIEADIRRSVGDQVLAERKRKADEARAAQPVLIANARWTGNRFVRYIQADLTNNTKKTIAHLSLSAKLFDSAGRRVGETSDSINNWAPGEVWSYKAPVFESSAEKMEWGIPTGF
jgi:hypothetical protein